MELFSTIQMIVLLLVLRVGGQILCNETHPKFELKGEFTSSLDKSLGWREDERGT